MSTVEANALHANALIVENTPSRSDGTNLRNLGLLIAAASLATTLSQPRVIGDLTITFLLRDKFHASQFAIALFTFLAVSSFYLKPFVGIVMDVFPLWGTRWRGYILLSAGLSAVAWLFLPMAAQSYASLLIGCIAVYSGLIMASSALGGLMVEGGQRFGAGGRLASLREIVQGSVGIVAALMGGWLAARPLGLTAAIGFAPLALLVVLALVLLKEQPITQPRVDSLARAKDNLRALARSRNLWIAAAFTFLLFVCPGFTTPIKIYERETLHFSTVYMGYMRAAFCLCGVLGAVLYASLCRKVSLRWLLCFLVTANVLATLLFYSHTRNTALLHWAINGFASIGAELAIMNLAIRATPRGCEALGFALVMSMKNLAGIGLSDTIGSFVMDRFHWQFSSLVLVNAGTTALILFLIPLLPKALVGGPEGHSQESGTGD